MTDPITWTNERRKIRDLIPWPRNPRQIKGEQVRRLQESVEEFGQFETVAVGPGNEVYNGHQRLKSWGAKYGPDYEVEVRVSSRELTEKEREKLTILAHKGAAGEWDFDTLANEFEVGELLEWGFSEKELQIGGFDLDEPKGDDPGAQIDKAEELREKWHVETGQLWQLGEHRLICGDCTDASTIEILMNGERAELAPVDPPYNVGFDYDGETVDDVKSTEKYEEFSHDWFEICQGISDKQIVTPGGVNYLRWARWFDSYHMGVWIKTNALTHGKVSNSWCWEPIFFFGAKWKKTRANDVFDYPIGLQKDTANHPCPKPLNMWIDLIQNYSEPKAIIFESFGGSGTTLIACERLGRKCRAVEISPAYVAVALQRWADMTGKTPVLIE